MIPSDDQIPLDFDPAWNIPNSLTSGTGYPSYNQSIQLDPSYSVSALELSDPSSYYTEQTNGGKWLPLTPEPWLPQNGNTFPGLTTSTQMPLSTDNGDWPATAVYDFSNYGPEVVDGQDREQGLDGGMNWM